MNIDRSIKPGASGEIDLHLPKIKELKLSNGLKVLFVHKKELPIIQSTIVTDGGSIFDPAYKKGLANLANMLIDEGAGGLNSLELDEEIESLGSILNTSVDHDTNYLSMLALKENFARTFEILSYLILDPTFSNEDFEKQKNKVLTRLLQLKDEPSYLAKTSFEKNIYNNNNYQYPVAGYENDIKTLIREDVVNFHNQIFSPSNSTLIVVGDITEEKLMSISERYLRKWENSPRPVIMGNIPSVNDNKYYYIHRDSAQQTEIIFGHLAGKRTDKDYYANVLLNSIFGGQFSSRINLNLREDKGYTYGAHSNFSYRKPFGSFIVSTSVQSEHTGESVREILKEIDGIKKEIRDDEIEFSKSYLIKKYPAQFETYSQISKNLSMLATFGLPTDYFDHHIPALSNTSEKEILEAAKNNLHNDKLTIICVGDRDIIRSQFDVDLIELDLNGVPK